jgi:hypothetical protein
MCPSASLSTTNLTRTALGPNPVLRGEKSAISEHCTAIRESEDDDVTIGGGAEEEEEKEAEHL